MSAAHIKRRRRALAAAAATAPEPVVEKVVAAPVVEKAPVVEMAPKPVQKGPSRRARRSASKDD